MKSLINNLHEFFLVPNWSLSKCSHGQGHEFISCREIFCIVFHHYNEQLLYRIVEGRSMLGENGLSGLVGLKIFSGRINCNLGFLHFSYQINWLIFVLSLTSWNACIFLCAVKPVVQRRRWLLVWVASISLVLLFWVPCWSTNLASHPLFFIP